MKKKIILSTLLALASLQSLGMDDWTTTKYAVVASGLCMAGLGVTAIMHNSLFIHPREHEKQAFYKLLLSKPWGDVAEKYITKLQQEEKKLLQEFFVLTRITPDQWEAYKMQITISFNQAEQVNINLAASHSDTFIQQIKQGMELIPENLIITGMPPQLKDAFCSMRNSIFIDSKTALTLTPDYFNSLIHHELVHILHDDVFVRYCITNKSIRLANNRKFKNLQKRILDLMRNKICVEVLKT